jgi:hypothetical protein
VAQRELLAACDESGVGDKSYYGVGTLWMPWIVAANFARRFVALQEEVGWQHEVKWTRISKHNIAAMTAMVDWFFTTKWLKFHCLVGEKATVDKRLHGGDYDLARRKHFTIARQRRLGLPNLGRPDCISYAKAHEAVENIANNVLARTVGRGPVDSVVVKESKDHRSSSVR